MLRAKLFASLCLPFVALLSAGPGRAVAAEAYTWTQIVLPSGTVGQASGLNDFGQIAVTDVTGTVSGIYQNGRFTPLLTPPAGFLVNAYAINNAGTIVGSASTTTDAHLQAFILQRGKYRFFFQSGWQNTVARAVGPSGLVVGISYQDDQNTWAGFAYDPSTGAFTDVTPPGSIYTIVQGVNRFGRIAGSGQDDSGRYAFIWQQSASANRALVPFFERINVEGFANARGINDEGVITGWVRSGGLDMGFVGSASRGYQLLVPPGGNAPNLSYCQGINNARQVSCIITDANNNPLGGFLGSPTEN